MSKWSVFLNNNQLQLFANFELKILKFLFGSSHLISKQTFSLLKGINVQILLTTRSTFLFLLVRGI